MKKFLALICTIACIFGMTACGSGENLTTYEQLKVESAKTMASFMVENMFARFFNDDAVEEYSEYTAEEIEYVVEYEYSAYGSFTIDGNAFASAIESYHSAAASMGAITGVTGSSAVIDGNQIIVEVEVAGANKNATAEFIFSNDMFLRLESASISPKSTTGELMGRAALNTLIGMGTVFIVLILISFIISGFKLISKVQENAAKKNAPQADSASAGNAPIQAAESEPVVEETDDLELVAVIAAAIAASEGAASTDGFVVRSIRRR